jgi:hypothetical protein
MIPVMSDENDTKRFDDLTFEERVFARFDSVIGRFDALEARVD